MTENLAEYQAFSQLFGHGRPPLIGHSFELWGFGCVARFCSSGACYGFIIAGWDPVPFLTGSACSLRWASWLDTYQDGIAVGNVTKVVCMLQVSLTIWTRSFSFFSFLFSFICKIKVFVTQHFYIIQHVYLLVSFRFTRLLLWYNNYLQQEGFFRTPKACRAVFTNMEFYGHAQIYI